MAIFDTCKLIDSTTMPNWQTVWAGAQLGAEPGLLLGFDGPAVMGRAAADRGRAFAENLLQGSTFADAWIAAVRSTCSHSQYRRAVAIGIGDTPAAAQSVLTTASLRSMPTTRRGGSPAFCERY